MARIVGVDLPKSKRVLIGLQSIMGIGPTRATALLEKSGLAESMRVHELSDEQVNTLSNLIQNDYRVEGDLRREVTSNIKRLMDINCYRGTRHKKGLPVNGQRTKTNARTRKGPRKMAVKKNN